MAVVSFSSGVPTNRAPAENTPNRTPSVVTNTPTKKNRSLCKDCPLNRLLHIQYDTLHVFVHSHSSLTCTVSIFGNELDVIYHIETIRAKLQIGMGYPFVISFFEPKDRRMTLKPVQ
jgi:hypothetical protein